MTRPWFARFIILLLLAFLPTRATAGNIENDRKLMTQVLKVVCKEVEDRFYDQSLKGLDWKTLKGQAEERIKKANNPREMDIAIFWLMDQLHDSHTLYVPPMHMGSYYYGFDAHAFGDAARVSLLRKGGPAENAGLKKGDHILALQGYPVDRNNIDFMMMAVQILRPSPELNVVYSRGEGEPQKTVIRAKVLERNQVLGGFDSLDDYIDSRKDAEDLDRAYGKSRVEFRDDGTAMIRVRDFVHDNIPSLAKKAQNASAFVVDLRGNHGGAVTILRDTIGYFEDQKVLISEMASRKGREQLLADAHRKSPTPPMVILVDAESSSAAEAFAYHFQRTKKAIVVGDRSSGRLTAARFYVEKLGIDSLVFFGVNVAEARVVFPDGVELEGVGVKPDEICVPSEADIREGRDVCLPMAFERLKTFKTAAN